MTIVDFYEKPGCVNNTKQKRLMQEAGYEVIAHDLLNTPWNSEVLRSFFGDKPVSAWFNVTAPRIKNGDIDPHSMTEASALAAMVEDPLLIRRPLIEVNGWRHSGFEPEIIAAHLPGVTTDDDLQSCPRTDNPCPDVEVTP